MAKLLKGGSRTDTTFFDKDLFDWLEDNGKENNATP